MSMKQNEMRLKAIQKIQATIETCLLMCGFNWPVICKISGKVTRLLNGAIVEQETKNV